MWLPAQAPAQEGGHLFRHRSSCEPDLKVFRLDRKGNQFALVYANGAVYIADHDSTKEAIRKVDTWTMNPSGSTV